MARDLRDKCRAALRPRPGFFHPASQWPPGPRGKSPAAVKAWPWFAPDPAQPASRRAQPNTATLPRSAPLPQRIYQSTVFDTRPEGTVLPQARELPGRVSPLPAAPPIPLAKSAPSIVLHYRRHQPRRKVLRHAIQRGVLLFKKVLNAVWIVCVCGNLVLVAENKIVRMIENLSRLALFKRDFALQGNQHGGRASRRRIEQQRYRFHTQHLAPQHRVAVRRVGNHAIRSLGEEFMHRGGRQSLLNAVAGRLVFQRRHCNQVNAL